MSFRRASSWFRCFCSSVSGSSETTTWSSAFMTVVTVLLAKVPTKLQTQPLEETNMLLTELDAICPTAHVGTPTHASLSRGCDFSFKPPSFCLFIVIHLLLQCFDLSCPFSQRCIGFRGYAEGVPMVHGAEVNETRSKVVSVLPVSLERYDEGGYMRSK